MMMPTGWMHHPGAKHHHHRREGGKEGLRQFDSRLGQNQEELSSLGSYKVCLFIYFCRGCACAADARGRLLGLRPVAPVAAGKKKEWEAAAREEEEDDDDGAGSVWPPVWLGHHATHAMAGGGPGGPPCGGGAAASLHSFFFEYDTPRIVLIKSRKVGLMNRLVQLAILAYVVGWVFVWQKGYQEKDSVVSSVTTKVKGVALTNTSKLGLRIWDVADYVIPPQGENSVFIMTNLIVTLNQTQGRCPEVPESDHSTSCQSDKDCKEGYAGTHSNGVQTGKCIPYNVTVKTCEVFAWCPVENDDNVPKPAFLKAAENFTLLVKNNIWYPKFNFTKRNILPTISKTYLKNCTYNAKTDPFCPIFRIGDVVEAAGQNFREMAVEGGVMGLQIDWNCDLDKPASRCVPTYTFRRIDNKDSAHTVSPGYNFRFAKYYKTADGTDSRTLIKAYGIRFDIMVFGKAGKFDIIPTMINIGSGLALFGVATVLCDIIVLYFMKKRYYYREKKYKYVEDYELGANLSYGSQSESQEINGNQ